MRNNNNNQRKVLELSVPSSFSINGIIKCILFFFLPLFSSCNGNKSFQESSGTTTSGNVNIVVDESFRQLFDTEIYTFQSFNREAFIHVKYLPENEGLKSLIQDSCKVVVMCRDLTKEERKNFEVANLFPISTKIAEDAIAILVNPENTDTTLTVDHLRSILLGTDSVWKQINEKSALGKIEVVFDNAGSANARYMEDTLLQGKHFSKNVFAVKSNPEVIDYVNKNKNAIGVLSVNWISDQDDTLTHNFLKRVNVLAISKDASSEAFKPYQAYIKTKDYPFTRSVYMINRQTHYGLGMGFVNFVAGQNGQLMILKAGLIPSIAPVRMVEINTK
jgi:phosphate transport system substrate-binding protein